MPRFQKNHIVIRGRTEEFDYTSVNRPQSGIAPRPNLNRQTHGQALEQEFSDAVNEFRQGEDDSDFVYLVFKSSPGFLLDLQKFDNDNFRIASLRTIEAEDQEPGVEVTVFLNKRAISKFLKKIKEYIEENTRNGNPKHQSLIANIEEIRAATLQSFWQEPELPFPENNEVVWWEVWLNREVGDNAGNPIVGIQNNLRAAGITTGTRFLKFPDHWIYMMRASAGQLAVTLLETDRLAELRRPKDLADFFMALNPRDQQDLIDNLRARVDHAPARTVSVCLLDTGVNRGNPLLMDIVPERHLDSVNAAWTNADTSMHGHGTPMAGLALYGDIADVLATNDRLQIFHDLESIKLIEQNAAHSPDLYGLVTQEAIARAVIINPQNKRIVCMAVSSDDLEHGGRPSSWSSAIDQTLFGSHDDPNTTTLICLSAGNLSEDDRINFPLRNDEVSIEDPGQSFNALTVGGYTLKDQVDLQRFIGARVLARRGQMSPCSATSSMWDNEWCKKPDIVMEGGNGAEQNGGLIHPESMQLLSLGKGGALGGGPWLTTFSDTSAATALASKFAATLYHAYPTMWPETIRGLIVHSAEWTPQMLNNAPITALSLDEKHALLRRVGYGVPNLQRAIHSANNSLSLIAERTFKPFKIEGSTVKTNKFNLFDLPWPIEALQELQNINVQLKITLSYFIEPNPGSKRYELAASYRSHGLRFKVISRGESLLAFKARVSKAMREEDYLAEGREDWIIGQHVRDKGTIHKDIWAGPAIDLANRNKIAVYPVGGWWKSRKKHGRYEQNVRFSIIVTIETPDSEVDIYTPVEAMVSVDVDVEINNRENPQ